MCLLIFYVFYVLSVVLGSSIKGGKFLCFEWETRYQRKMRIKAEQQAQCATSIRPKMIFTGLCLDTRFKVEFLELAIKTNPPMDSLPIINSISPNKVSPIIPPGLLTVDCVVNVSLTGVFSQNFNF